MFNNLRISHRLVIMAAFSAAVFIGSIVIGLVGLQQARDALKTVYLDRTIPLYDLGRINDLMQHNYIETLLAFQHNPESSTHLLHEHAISLHISNVRESKAKIDEIWQNYMQTYLTDEEKVLAADFANKRKVWVGKLTDTLDQLEHNNFNPTVIANFLKAGRESQEEASQAMDKLLALQTAVSKSEYENAQSNFASISFTFGFLFIGWCIASSLIFYSTIHHINTALHETSEAVTSIAQGNFTRPLPKLAHDELG